MKIPCSLPVKEGDYVFLVNDGCWHIEYETPAGNKERQDVDSPELNRLWRKEYRGIYQAGAVNVIRFADLHRHSDCSLMDGLSKIPDMVKKTEYAGALTDHGNMYGFVSYYKAMKAAGKKPILGFEAYTENLEGDLCGAHLILLAKNLEGYKNLLYLTSESFEHFHKKPHVTWEMLRSHHEGVIATSACMAGVAGQYIQKGNLEAARFALKEYQKIFGEDFYIEIQRHHFPEEEAVMGQMAQLAAELGIKLLATVDSHYTDQGDKQAHESLLCLQTKKTLLEEHWTFSGDGYYIHTSEEMEVLFHDLPEALDNTLDVADKCDVVVPLGDINMPHFEVPQPFQTPEEYFEYLCSNGFKKRFAGTPKLKDPEYLKRYSYEMNMIRQMGFVSYFLIVQDYCNYARDHDIYVGPGRGSAAGSLLAYCLGITDLDPIELGLLFERFLNPERISMPDVDIDFEHTRRHEVLEYVTNKYGAENVCHIVTFGTLAAKQSVKDMARVMGYPVSLGLTISKMIPQEPHMTLDKAMAKNPEFKSSYENDADVKKVVDMAKYVEGCRRNSSVHACGFVLSNGPVRQYLPVSKELDPDTGLKVITSQVVGPEVEELSLLKMDFLGLKNMTVIHDVIRNIAKTRGIKIDYHEIPLDDRATYEMLRDGQTGGVFQLESAGMTSVVSRMLSDLDDLKDDQLHECFERMIAAVALYRPGPMDFIDDYIAGMRNKSMIHYDCPEEESILSSTYGVMVYQEQLMQIAQKLAGYTLGRADILRKACGKKKKDLMDAEHAVFVYGDKASGIPGCVGNGIQADVAEEIWNKMTKFASYAFNRSHAACYAYIAMITAYMRCHWGPEFYAAMCDAFYENSDKLQNYLIQATKAHIKILPPDINLSGAGFISDNGKDIRFGFSGLKGVKNFASKFVAEREEHGPFQGPQDLYHRMNMRNEKPNKTILASLTWSGALDSFGYTKTSLMDSWKNIEKASDEEKNIKETGQVCLFGRVPVSIPNAPEASDEELMNKEREMVGFYLSKHPIDAIYPLIDPSEHVSLLADLPDHPSKHVKTVGLISNVKPLFTKKEGKRMFTFTLSDRFSDIRCVVFPADTEANASQIKDDAVVLVDGALNGEDEDRQIIVRTILSRDQILKKRQKIIVKVHSKDEQERLLAYINGHRGKTPVVLLANGKLYPLKRGVQMSAAGADWLTQNFEISCG